MFSRSFIAREWLICLGCLLIGLTLVPLVIAIPTVGPAVMREIQYPLTPGPPRAGQPGDTGPSEVFQELRRFVRTRKFEQIPDRDKMEAVRAFLVSNDPEIAELDSREQMYVASGLLQEAEPPLVKLRREYGDFYKKLWDRTWIFALIPYLLVQLVRSVVWAVRVRRSP
jgi:hypothetical protein